MNRDAIFEVVKANVLKVLPEVGAAEVTPDKCLVELGANSVDRVEVTMYSMEALALKVPRIEFHGVRTLADLVEVLQSHLNRK
jgi:acyl carrier protein